jgi:hypothetical protein
MSVEQHTHPEIEKDVDGFGARLNEMEKLQEGEKVKTARNEKDITDLFKLVGENAATMTTLEKSVAGMIGKVAGATAAVVTVIGLVFTAIQLWLRSSGG